MKEMVFEHANMKYCIPSDMERKGGIWILRAGRSSARPNYSVGPKISENCAAFCPERENLAGIRG